MKKRNVSTSAKQAFTIMELSIVIAVISILAAVLIPTFASIVHNAEQSSALQNARNAYYTYISEQKDGKFSQDAYIVTDQTVFKVENGKISPASDMPIAELETQECVYVTDRGIKIYFGATHDCVDGICGRCGIDRTPTAGITYTLTANGASVTKYTGEETDVRIAHFYQGKPVTEIGSSAFYESAISSVMIPDSVASIGNYAFVNCDNLTSIIIPDAVTSIGYKAFYGCGDLKSMDIGACTATIAIDAVEGCSALAEFCVSDLNTAYQSIDGNLYSKDGKKLIAYAVGKTDSEFTIPDGVTYIGEGACRNSKHLTSVIIGDSVIEIGDSAFSTCSKLASVTLGNTVENIGVSAFTNCDSLTEIRIPRSVKMIGNDAFSDSGLQSVELGNITSIGANAFENCRSLTNLVIPDSVTSIGEWAFGYCSGLTSVTIGASVDTISEHAFYDCGSLTEIIFKGTTDQWANVHKRSNWYYDSTQPVTKITCANGEVTLN